MNFSSRFLIARNEMFCKKRMSGTDKLQKLQMIE